MVAGDADLRAGIDRPCRARPNLLLITVDDMNADSVGAFGAAVAGATPHIDTLAAAGLRFDMAHVQVANCMPSRNVMWSGRYPHSSGIEGFKSLPKVDYSRLANCSGQAGYLTAIRHKLKDSSPTREPHWELVLDNLPEAGRLHRKDAASYGLSTAAAIRAANRADKPFAVLINIADPHVPFYGYNKQGEAINDPHVPSRVFAPREIPVPGFLPDDAAVREELSHYYNSVRRADDAVGAVLRALDASGQAEHTLVLFLADHGMPLPFAKTQLYHHSTRTPLIVRWPGVTAPGSVDTRAYGVGSGFVADTAGDCRPPSARRPAGPVSSPLLRGERQDGREHVFKQYTENSGGQRRPMRAVQTPRYLYIFNPWSDGKRRQHSATANTHTWRRMVELARQDAAVAARVHLLRHRVPEEFYDVVSDPDCRVNLIDDPALREEMRRAARRARRLDGSHR
ncbi:MAG: sulfatase-like hydrolase/transferase [Halioglobus sp.]|nr:sulfatase-like hydrolase/transferase [Halioglobus sp.]